MNFQKSVNSIIQAQKIIKEVEEVFPVKGIPKSKEYSKPNDNLNVHINQGKDFINGIKDLITAIDVGNKPEDDSNPRANNYSEHYYDSLEKIELICNKFHRVAQQMRSRYNSRKTLEINDEYDVQDLFYSLLVLYFDDIRKEESNPSYAGANSRADFLLKSEQTIIEIKKTRSQLDNKKLGEELTLDIIKYQTHPDCKTLVCFVYDPEGKIINPRGLERDLEKNAEKINVKVFIRQS